MKKTQVKIEYFKNYGGNKFYDSMQYESDIPCWDAVRLKEEAAIKMKQFASEFHYTLEVREGDAWNKYLIIMKRNNLK